MFLTASLAHFQAATKPDVQILHRDISGGNILIIPCILTDKNGAEIKWRGLLTDWEMSKPINLDQPKGIEARQLERTVSGCDMFAPNVNSLVLQGTWQFLSVALLSRPKEVEICDELEAFFYVILYYAVRYLRSNIDESAVGSWISNFFDTYGVKANTYICGEKKWETIQNGTLVAVSTKTTSTFVTFYSPMDAVLEDLLKWFKAHHVVTQYDLQKKESTEVPLEGSSGAAHSNDGRQNPRPRPQRPNKQKAPRKPRGRTAGEPSAEDREFCNHVLTHDEMMDRLEEALDDTSVRWMVDDKMGDRVAKDFRPPVQPAGPTLPASLVSNKRRKVDVPQLPGSLPILPSKYPPKTPERKRSGVPHHTMAYGWKNQH